LTAHGRRHEAIDRFAGIYGRIMIRGAHVVLYSSDAEADRTFLRDVLEFPFVDAGHDWLIFALPPTELAVHPSDVSAGYELFLMCDDVAVFISRMTERGVMCSELSVQRWGSVTHLTLPSGGTLGVYQPAHPSPLDAFA
jgi:catechol 2,3-dioxygenase-like lactoylglutathione lyase family enzyme